MDRCSRDSSLPSLFADQRSTLSRLDSIISPEKSHLGPTTHTPRSRTSHLSPGALAMNNLAGRKKADKKPELTEDEKFSLALAGEVAAFMTLHKAAYFGQVKNLERSIEAKLVATDAYDVESGNTALILAARNGHLRCVATLVEKGKAAVNLAGFGGLTALAHACKNDHLEVVAYLLDHAKAAVNTEDDGGNTPVLLCARMGNLKCLELLAAKGASLTHQNKRGVSALGTAVLNGRMALVDWFLKQHPPADVNHKDKDGSTPLHYAASVGHARIVKQLLMAGAKLGVDNVRSERAEDVAANETIKALIKTFGGGASE